MISHPVSQCVLARQRGNKEVFNGVEACNLN